MGRTEGAKNKSEREHKQDAKLALERAKVARLKKENQELKKKRK
jgi:hypothetical protein